MRIDLNAGATTSGSQTEKPSSHVARAGARQTNQTQSSESGTSVGKLETAALNSPEVRSEKVQALRSQLQSGTFGGTGGRLHPRAIARPGIVKPETNPRRQYQSWRIISRPWACPRLPPQVMLRPMILVAEATRKIRKIKRREILV